MVTIINTETPDAGAGNGSIPVGDIIKDSDTNNFSTDVIDQSTKIPVVVDFWAPWCEPCKQLSPVLENIVNDCKGRIHLAKINIDENQQIANYVHLFPITTRWIDNDMFGHLFFCLNFLPACIFG